MSSFAYRLSLLLLLCALLLTSGCEQRTVTVTQLPWQIELLENGGSQVFGITLGQTTTVEARSILNRPAEIGLFESPDGELSLEAYFGNVELGRIIAKVVARIGTDDRTLEELHAKGFGREPMPSGAFRLNLPEEEVLRVQELPLVGLTYAPAYARLDDDTLLARFGEPGERIGSNDDDRRWLYPDKGLLIIRDGKNRAVMEYVAPRDFERLRARVTADSSRSGGGR